MKLRRNKRQLLEHQAKGFSLFMDKDQAAFFMEMRLGKSLLSLRWVKHRMQCKGISHPRILIVAPLTPLLDWMDELEREDLSYVVVSGHVSKRKATLEEDEFNYHLVTYQTLVRTPLMRVHPWDAILLDESTFIKNPRAKITKEILRWYSRVPVRAILSGLPKTQSFGDLWCQMSFIKPRWMGFSNYWKWRDALFVQYGYEWVLPPSSLARIKAKVHADSYFLTRKQAGIGSEMVTRKHLGTMDKNVAAVYRRAIDKWAIPGIETKNSLEVSTWLRRMCGGFLPSGPVPCWKYDHVLDLVTNEFADERVVMWFAFNRELARMWRILKTAGVSATWVHGGVGPVDRKKRIRMFRQGKRRVFLCQLACGKYGLDLSCADTQIYFSNSHSYEAKRQSMDRMVHPKKKTPLLTIELITGDSADVDVLEALKNHDCDARYLASRIQSKGRKP